MCSASVQTAADGASGVLFTPICSADVLPSGRVADGQAVCY
jgi:hypothetical protein